MRLVIQRVTEASVSVDGRVVASIERGLLILVGVETADSPDDIPWLTGKVSRMRIFPDEAGLMNASVGDVGGEVLVISQFTLFASTKKGNRPSFIRAAAPDLAAGLYDRFCDELSIQLDQPVKRGIFGADMKVSLVNDGPVTIVIDSRNRE